MQAVTLITGAGRGIGAAIAERLAAEGHSLFINDRDAVRAQTVAETLKKRGVQTDFSSHDVSKPDDAQALIEAAHKRFGRLDVCVNNAGITRDALLLKMTPEQWSEVIAVNLSAVFFVGQAAAHIFKTQNSGNLINISSVSWLGNVGQSNYSASKAGVVSLTHVWALELARYNVRVNAIAPGFIDTELSQQVPGEIRERFTTRVPLKRFGKTSEIAEVAQFLASSASSYLTGQVLHVDGGLTSGLGSL